METSALQVYDFENGEQQTMGEMVESPKVTNIGKPIFRCITHTVDIHTVVWNAMATAFTLPAVGSTQPFCSNI